ncbi:MAG: PASTA domain-containing protein [Actinomycetota bacterium]
MSEKGKPGGGLGSPPKWVWITVIALCAIAVVVVVMVLIEASGTQTVTVPDIVGLTEEQATQALSNIGLNMRPQGTYAQSELQKEGVIVAQDPVEGTTLDEGSTVTAVVTVEMRMPDLLGMSESAAVNTLNGMGIKDIRAENSTVLDETRVGTVLVQSPLSGMLITPEVSVVLQVGGEVENIIVPNVVGVEESTAVSQLENAGLEVKVVEQASSLIEVGIVISQSPAAGQPARKGSTVTIVVSKAQTP